MKDRAHVWVVLVQHKEDYWPRIEGIYVSKGLAKNHIRNSRKKDLLAGKTKTYCCLKQTLRGAKTCTVAIGADVLKCVHYVEKTRLRNIPLVIRRYKAMKRRAVNQLKEDK